MTGTQLYTRQHSSSAGTSNVDKKGSRKLRRWSSADEHNHESLEPIPDEQHYSKIIFAKKDKNGVSDTDSGTEDDGQQVFHGSDFQAVENDQEYQFSTCSRHEDEGYDEHELHNDGEVAEDMNHLEATDESLLEDWQLARRIPDEDKKFFCPNTKYVFHAEFYMNIRIPISTSFPGIECYLATEEELDPHLSTWLGGEIYHYTDNAKSQHQCPQCKNVWTSMRSRIFFTIVKQPSNIYFILKLYRQNCKHCQTPSDPLWYPEEVCSAMRRLARTVHQTFSPDLIHTVPEEQQPVQLTGNYSNRPWYNPNQRKGRMRAPHDRANCEACRDGVCFPDQ